jgi:hypothetical protein
VRLQGHVIIELCLAGALLAGGSIGAVHGIRYLRADVSGADGAPAVPGAPLGAHGDLSSVPDVRVALETTGTFMGMSDELLL